MNSTNLFENTKDKLIQPPWACYQTLHLFSGFNFAPFLQWKASAKIFKSETGPRTLLPCDCH